MGDRMSEKKEFTCCMCKKEFDEICKFSEYGTEKRKAEALKDKSYCDGCFDIKAEQLDS